MTLSVSRLRNLPFETEIIERYRRRESSVEEALVGKSTVMFVATRLRLVTHAAAEVANA